MPATLTPETDEKQERRVSRVPITLPLKVEGKDDTNTSWDEISRLNDVSPFGASFNLTRPVKRGRLVQLTLPMPRRMRCYDHMESQYKVWAIVRRCILVEDENGEESYFHGVAFIGKQPPKSYFENPATLYELTQKEDDGLWSITYADLNPDESHLPKQDRRHSRYGIPVNLKVEILDKDGTPVNSETTVTENVSLGGASVFTSLNVEVNSFIKVTSDQYDIAIKAIVRGKRIGPDGIPRLHIEFIDNFFPLKGIDL